MTYQFHDVRPVTYDVPESEQFLSQVEPLVLRGLVPADVCESVVEDNRTKARRLNYNGLGYMALRNDYRVVEPLIAKLFSHFSPHKLEPFINSYYGTSFKYRYLTCKSPPYMYSVFHEGHYCADHIDVIRTASGPQRAKRRLTTILYLSGNPEAFQGGELRFNSVVDASNQPYLVTPGRGDVVVFPATPKYRHEVLKVTKGERHTLVMFLEIDQ